MKKEPRYYQIDAAKALVRSMQNGNRPYAQLSTGSGKSLVLAMLSNWALKQDARVLQLVPKMELAQQNYKEAVNYIDRPHVAGVCCSKMNRNEYNRQLVIATPGSIVNKINGRSFDYVYIDECHLFSPNPKTQYYKILDKLGWPKLAGVSATPYRYGQGELYNDCLEGKAVFNDKVYETDIKRMIAEGYLSHIESISGDIEINSDELKIKGKDYDTELMGVKFDEILEPAVQDIKLKFEEYSIKTAIIYCSTIANAEKVLNLWGNDDIRLVHGKMNASQRKEAIDWIKNHHGNRYIVNVDMYTTGFDYPLLDCVVFLRATTSLNLYIQICGRVLRAADGKFRGYVLDYGTNIDRFGAIDETLPPKPKKKKAEPALKPCLLCHTLNYLAAKKCKECEALFISDNDNGLYSMRSHEEVLRLKDIKEYDIETVLYASVMSKTGQPMITMDFISNNRNIHKEFLCLDHRGKARDVARAKFRELLVNKDDYYKLIGNGYPINVENAYYLLNNEPKYFKQVSKITLEKQENSKYKKLRKIEWA